MSSLNKNRSNHIDNFVIQAIIKEIAYYIKNILIVNNIDYSKKFSLMADFQKYLGLLKKYFYFFFSKQNYAQEVISK